MSLQLMSRNFLSLFPMTYIAYVKVGLTPMSQVVYILQQERRQLKHGMMVLSYSLGNRR